MFIEQIPKILRLFMKGVLWRMSPTEKSIYITFDDGPTVENTVWILDLLDKYGIKATFFCVGRNVEKYPELYSEILKRGHSTGVHGYDHKRGLYKDDSIFMADIKKAGELIESHLFRPPHGHIKPSQIKALSGKYQVVLWDVLTRDYDQNLNGDKVLDIAKRYSRNGSIVVFHDSVKATGNMRYALPKAIEYWIEQGFKFEKINSK
ncbi:MAG: polysaccharide deacetylase family protein [Paludibacteraceae bacterium]|nr:polysaccharide deacetylase family protein [Paludibacteraceae bacterium]